MSVSTLIDLETTPNGSENNYIQLFFYQERIGNIKEMLFEADILMC